MTTPRELPIETLNLDQIEAMLENQNLPRIYRDKLEERLRAMRYTGETKTE